MDEELHTTPWLRRIVVAVLLAGLVLLSYVVLRPFLVPVIWALILAYVTWPLYVRLRALLRSQVTLAAIIMTLLLTAAFIAPVVWFASMLRHEVGAAYDTFAGYLAGHPHVPDSVRAVPWLGEWLEDFIERVGADPHALRQEIANWVDQSLGEIRTVLGGVGRNLA